MPRKEIKNIPLKMTFPRIAPYSQVGHYRESQQMMNHVQMPGYELDKPAIDPSMNLIICHRKYKKTTEELVEKRKFFEKEHVLLVKQWDNLKELEVALRENFVKLSNFIRSNEEKRGRAIERHREDSKLCEERDKDIQKLQEQIKQLQVVKQELDVEICKHQIYEKYLSSVVGASDEFKINYDLIDRYESLVKTRGELGIRQNSTLIQLEQAKNKIAHMTDENHFILLGMNNILASLNSRYQIALSNAMHWERIVWSIKSRALQKFAEIAEVKQACRNIYMLMCRRKGETPKIPEDNFEKQLIYIKKTLLELAKVRSRATVTVAKEFSSMKPEGSNVS